MANGDLALTLGITLVAGTADKRLGYDEMNRILDLLAQTKIDLSNSRKSYRQLDTTNSVPTGGVIQSGIAKIRGDGSNAISKAITFPQAFASIPVLPAPNYHGYRTEASGAFDPVGLVTAGSVRSSANGTTLAGTTLHLAVDSAGFAAGINFYVGWVALGVLV